MTPPHEALDALDGCDADMTADPLPDDESDLFVLFADALDSSTPTTVEGRRTEWEALFGAPH